MACSIGYMSYYLLMAPQSVFDGWSADGWWSSFLRFWIYLSSFFLLLIEWGSLVNGQSFRKKAYAERVLNLLMFANIIMTNLIVFMHSYAYDYDRQSDLAQTASVVIVITWLQFIWWLRIFKKLSLYVILIYMTISEIVEFFLIFLLCIVMFGNAIWVLNKSRLNLNDQQSEVDPLYDTTLGWGMFDAMMSEYRYAYTADAFEKYMEADVHWIVWAYYIGACLITQITFMNMVINIMGQTFGHVDEFKDRLVR
jgi:hypothetical protein